MRRDGRLALYKAKTRKMARKWYNTWEAIINVLSELKDAEKIRRIKALVMIT
ncbi:hypothetical protein [Vulcanisaeta souniana]|uniref:Uncharacterized protein n=1 Tax=Vulcanisaeta souniana JCM 11219 TaxID=1293586 RepID=A0ABM8BME8_9CREN|nr:hypothetical protein [Vulcanisaeta souniana]BDR92181.1 hypothetical protein Vsou_12740 [Vulcanisaeta souniana JCM 11219]